MYVVVEKNKLVFRNYMDSEVMIQRYWCWYYVIRCKRINLVSVNIFMWFLNILRHSLAPYMSITTCSYIHFPTGNTIVCRCSFKSASDRAGHVIQWTYFKIIFKIRERKLIFSKKIETLIASFQRDNIYRVKNNINNKIMFFTSDVLTQANVDTWRQYYLNSSFCYARNS